MATVQYKTCSKCKRPKPVTEFHKSKKDRYGRQSRCKSCANGNSAKHFIENKQHYREKSRKQKQAVRGWYFNLKAKLKCCRCPESHSACLDFHHRNPKTKRFNIASAVWEGLSIPKILAEIKKCDVVCSNCHRKMRSNSVLSTQ